MYKCHLPDPTKDDKPVQAKGQQLTEWRVPVQDVGMRKTTTMEVMMTSMIQLMSKAADGFPTC
jgi:hypothetical protein